MQTRRNSLTYPLGHRKQAVHLATGRAVHLAQAVQRDHRVANEIEVPDGLPAPAPAARDVADDALAAAPDAHEVQRAAVVQEHGGGPDPADVVEQGVDPVELCPRVLGVGALAGDSPVIKASRLASARSRSGCTIFKPWK